MPQVSHSHDDVGWLKTFEQYYAGLNNSIQGSGVGMELNTIIPSLEANPDRRFTFVEQAFFQRWWQEQGDDMRARTQAVVQRGQLSFANAGTVMHDEATPTYVDMIDQTTRGNRMLQEALGVAPTNTWEIDDFGHTAWQSVLQGLAGYHASYAARIDYQELDMRNAMKTREMMWRASASRPDAWSMQGIFWRGTYCWAQNAPNGLQLDADVYNTHATPIQDSPDIEGYNMPDIVDLLVTDMHNQANTTLGSHVMLLAGCDFQYANAYSQYTNLDKLVHYCNADGRLNCFYSDVDTYTAARAASGTPMPDKAGADFMPYRDHAFASWAGYFSSRPALKAYIRDSSSVLQAARALGAGQALAGGAPGSLDWLEQAVAITQHHDAITGTERQHVAFDYAKHLSKGAHSAAAAIDSAMKAVTGAATQWVQCELANVSICAATESGVGQAVTLVNPTAQNFTWYARVPVPASTSWRVVGPTGLQNVTAQLIPASARDVQLRRINGGSAQAMQWLTWAADLPAFGFVTYFLVPARSSEPGVAVLTRPTLAGAGLRGSAGQTLQGQHVAATVGGAAGLIQEVASASGRVDAAQSWAFYNASWGVQCEGDGCTPYNAQPAGAYVMRANSTTPFAVGPAEQSSWEVVSGPVVSEARSTVSDWVTQVTRVYAAARAVEVEYTVGPVPFHDAMGKEVFTRFDSTLATGGTFFTDANARDMMPRQRNARPDYPFTLTDPIADNYYPVTAALELQSGSAAFSLMPDRTQGGSSIEDGSAELLVHRRLLVDDWRGVGEPLNETGLTGEGLITRGSTLLFAGGIQDAAVARRTAMQQQLFKPLVLLAPLAGGATPSTWAQKFHTAASWVSSPLPPNVHLLTVDMVNYGPGRALVRVAHLFQQGEHQQWSQPATVSLRTLLRGAQLANVVETNVRGTEPVSKFEPPAWTLQGGGSLPQHILQRYAANPPAGVDLRITLQPMDIRTFLCDVVA